MAAINEQTLTTDQSSVFFLSGHSETHLPSVTRSIQKLMPDQPSEFTYIGTARSYECAPSPVIKSPSQLLVELYRRRLKPLGTGGNTILSAESQMAILQLCLAEHNKQYDVYDTDASEVLQMLRKLNNQKLSTTFTDDVSSQDSSESFSLSEEPVRCLYEAFLKSCNMVDMMDVHHAVKTLIETDGDWFKSFREQHGLIVLQWPHEVLERNILRLLCGQPGKVTEINVDILTDTLEKVNEDNIKLHITQRDWDTVQDMEDNKSFSASPPKTQRSPVSTTEVLVHQVFLSFLGLLVNSRDELSLARCLSYSPTGLDHKGFTALKNLAKLKNMSMYQTAVSYITKLRLGGRSYAPGNEGAFLGDNVKSLSEFVTNVQKLQVLLEEVPDTRLSINKILVSVKALLCKCRGSVFKTAAVEKVCQTFKSKFDVLMTTYNQSSQTSPPKTANQGGSVLGRKTLKVIQTFLDQETTRPTSHSAVTMLSDCILTQATPVRMPSLLAQFRSPEVIDQESPENQSLRDRIDVPNQEVKQPKRFGNQSDMAWAEPTERNPLQDKDMNQINQSPNTDQFIKLWAVTPPEKRRQAKVITHEFNSPTGPIPLQPSARQPSLSVTDHTPKRPKGCGRKITEAAMDKENVCAERANNKKGGGVKRRVKRVLMEDTGSSQPSKKAKKNTGGVKKKQVTLVKGQKTLNQFFRV
ncbi:PCNA-interacting partner-like isoform X2 [Asterias rubens]|uniref:PCNA-interacting partner-like isoform X2 n=1 Tax=Asterias rubens TaxID=7604 RepID=UPI0014556011|nr:PCNA-interacting partner-like isoform X2 [Asterias rubens]